MSRYIDADRVVDTLRRLRLAYSAEGQQHGAAALVVAIRIIEDAPGYARADVRDQLLLPERDVADDGYKAYLKGSMARELGAYAAQQGYIDCREQTVKYGDGRPHQQALLMRAAFLQPIEPKFNPGDDSPSREGERHGRWIPTEYDSYADGAPVWDKWECSECGHEHSGEEDTLTPFCPGCGARMDATDTNVGGKGGAYNG